MGIGVYWGSQFESQNKLCDQTDFMPVFHCTGGALAGLFDWQLLNFSSVCVCVCDLLSDRILSHYFSLEICTKNSFIFPARVCNSCN